MNTQFTPVEREGQRVLFTSQLAEAYGTDTKVISKNFARNKERYREGVHYYVLDGEAKREFLNHRQIDDGSKNATRLYLWTERGALLHAKSINTDRAWAVYEQLVETYFRVREIQNNLYPPKSSSLGEVTSWAKLQDRILIAERASPQKRAIAFVRVAKQFGIDVIPDFIEPLDWKSRQLALEAASPVLPINPTTNATT